MPDKKYPRIGIGVMIKNQKDEILMGLRHGSHGKDEWSFPGGHLDWGEKMTETAKREVKEETELEINEFELISVADELRYIKSDDKHYVNIGFIGKYQGGEPKIEEPGKCLEWRWFSLDKLPDKIFEGTEMMIKNFKAGKIYQEKAILDSICL